jgi:hypothetical protein
VTIELVTTRKSTVGYNKMMEMWNWCETAFGPVNCFFTWDASFATSSENWVKFIFYDEKLATAFKLMYPAETMLLEDFEMIRWKLEDD